MNQIFIGYLNGETNTEEDHLSKIKWKKVRHSLYRKLTTY